MKEKKRRMEREKIVTFDVKSFKPSFFYVFRLEKVSFLQNRCRIMSKS